MFKVSQGWWDRETDQNGQPIRPDVRAAAREIWERASTHAESVLGDSGAAGELMELTVAQASRYLERKKVPIGSRSHVGLLLIIFRRLLARHHAMLSRIEPVGGTEELSYRVPDRWALEIDERLDLAKVIGMLSDRTRGILSLRSAGYEWSEIAVIMNEPADSVKGAFWHEVRRLRCQFRPFPSRKHESLP